MKIPRKTVIKQLLTYCYWAERSGVYFGPKDQFDNRHKEAMDWLYYILNGLD